MDLDPYSVFINAFYAVSLPNKAALDHIRFAIDLGPNNYLVHMFAGEIYRRNQMYEESIAELRRAKELSPQQTLSDVALIAVLRHVGRTDEARVIADRMFTESKTRYIPPPHLAIACEQLDEKDKVFSYLEEGLKVRDPKMVFLNEAPWSEYAGDPRFQDLKLRAGFTR